MLKKILRILSGLCILALGLWTMAGSIYFMIADKDIRWIVLIFMEIAVSATGVRIVCGARVRDAFKDLLFALRRAP